MKMNEGDSCQNDGDIETRRKSGRGACQDEEDVKMRECCQDEGSAKTWSCSVEGGVKIREVSKRGMCRDEGCVTMRKMS